jgi:hypothetical protein
MSKEIKYLTYSEVDDIFQNVYASGWPAPKMSGDDEQFAVLIQQATMRKNGLKIPTLEVEE